MEKKQAQHLRDEEGKAATRPVKFHTTSTHWAREGRTKDQLPCDSGEYGAEELSRPRLSDGGVESQEPQSNVFNNVSITCHPSRYAG